jgi:hypothetical protein
MRYQYTLRPDDVERIETGGPLNELERVIVELHVRRHYHWALNGHPVTLRWSDQWTDGLHVEGTPLGDWPGTDYFPGQRTRMLVLGYFTPALPEPEPANGLIVDEATADFLSSL